MRLLKPVVAGLGLAFFATAFLDKPAPVFRGEEIAIASGEAAGVARESRIIAQSNVMKLGSPLSAGAVENEKTLNPLSSLEGGVEGVVGEVNATALEPVAIDPDSEN